MPGTYDKDDQIIELKAELATAKDDLMAERKAATDAFLNAKAILCMLPTTADGKPVAPGMDVWEVRASGEIRKCYVLSVNSEKAECRCGWDGPDPAWYRCYSSETAAQIAKREGTHE